MLTGLFVAPVNQVLLTSPIKDYTLTSYQLYIEN